MAAKRSEPAILRAVGGTVREHDGIVLIHREQAFPATRRAEDGDRVRTRRRAPPLFAHAPLGEHGGLLRQRAELARDHRRDVAPGQFLGQQGRRDLRQPGPGGAERVHILGLVDAVAERDGLRRAQPQQVARRQGPDHTPDLVDHAEMADLEPVHAPDGAIDEGVGGNGRERLTHELSGRHIEGGRPMLRECAQEVALGDDAGVGRAQIGGVAIGRPHVEGRHLLLHHLR